MAAALREAERAAKIEEVPIGAVVWKGETQVVEACNATVERGDPTAHAERIAIERALTALGTDRLTDCTLYVTLEPCAMCAGAICWRRSDGWSSAPMTTKRGWRAASVICSVIPVSIIVLK